MNIIDAIKSGQKFNRPNGQVFLPRRYMNDDDSICATLSYEDILATDWETEVIKKELSAEDIREAAHNAQFPNEENYALFVDCILKQLGLE